VSESITTTPAEGTIPARRRDEARKPEGDAPIAARTGDSSASDEPAPDEGEAAKADAGASKGAPRWMHVARLLLAPVLAMGAMGVHWALNVPAHVSVSAKDQGAKKDPKKKAPRKKTPAVKPRPVGEIEATWKRHKDEAFEDEPVRSTWTRGAQSLVNKTVVVARKSAFEGAPEEPRVSVLDVTCKTIRCRFVLRSPFPHELDLVAGALEQVKIDGESVWLGFETARVDPPRENLPKDESYLQVTVAFTADDLDDADMKVVDDEAVAGGAADTEDEMPE
jgi:hypothetical protein